MKVFRDIFDSDNVDITKKSIEDFSNKIGIYISSVLLEATRPDGPWTAQGFKTNDPRMKNLDLLSETWLSDTIDHDFILKQFLQKYDNAKYNNYQTLLNMFESTFPDIYKKTVFYEKNAECRLVREEKEKNNKNKQQKNSNNIELSQQDEGARLDKIYDEFTSTFHKLLRDKNNSESEKKIRNKI